MMGRAAYRHEQDTTVLGEAYLSACRIELEGLKPGNVSVHSPGHGMSAADFVRSAEASVDPLTDLTLCLGERVYRAVAATHNAVGANTNLGIVLLCAPLIHACLRGHRRSIRENLAVVLRSSDVNDARWVYRAIRLASPAGLGRSQAHDVSEDPTVTLREAMQAAAHRDRIAFQYANDYMNVFGFGLHRLNESQLKYQDEVWAAVALFLGFLARFSDSHIRRKFGEATAKQVMDKAVQLEARFLACDVPEGFTGHLRKADAEFKSAGINPGTTADLTVATMLAQRLEELFNADKQEVSSSSNLQGANLADVESAAY